MMSESYVCLISRFTSNLFFFIRIKGPPGRAQLPPSIIVRTTLLDPLPFKYFKYIYFTCWVSACRKLFLVSRLTFAHA